MKKHLIIALCSILTVMDGKAQYFEGNWTPEYHLKFKTITNTVMSPNGSYLAYVVREAVMHADGLKYVSQIWVASSDGNFNEQFTGNDKSCYAPMFSPDGKNIAYISTQTGVPQIYIMNLLDGRSTQITTHEKGVEQFKWAKDGLSIYFIQKEIVRKKNNQENSPTFTGRDFKYARLYSVDLENNNIVSQLTDAKYSITSFDISPNGENIAFSYGYDSAVSTDYYNSDIALLNLKSGKITSIIKRTGIDRNPVFSPDGKILAFETTNGQVIPNGTIDLNVVNLASKMIFELPKTPNRCASIIDFDNTGSKLYFNEAIGTSNASLVMGVDNSYWKSRNTLIIKNKTVQITGRSVITKQEGTSSAFDVSSTGLMSFVYQTTENPPEVFVKDLKTDKDIQISHINELFDMPDMGHTELIKWKTKDGREIEGLLTYPVGYYTGQKCPIILYVNGQANGAFSNTFTGEPSIYMVQSFAEKGFAVLRPNPRGSTGYGYDFRQISFRDWGFDLVSGLDQVIEMGVGDPENQFMMCWSYGGYMTSFAVSKSKRFNAASVGAGLFSIIKMVSESESPDLLSDNEVSDLWANIEMDDKESLVYSIKNVSTPTQVIHEQDNIYTPAIQGQDYFMALNIKGVDSEFVLYPKLPDNPHDMKILMDVSGRIIKWFEKYLK